MSFVVIKLDSIIIEHLKVIFNDLSVVPCSHMYIVGCKLYNSL